MKVVRLEAIRFGPLRERTLELDARCSVVLGQNEAGKSSFLTALETVLFGFDPARRETHPLARFPARSGGQGDLELVAEILLDSGERVSVERVLQERGKLRRAEPGQPFEGTRRGNQGLAEVGGVPRSLYRSVYALSAEDLVALDDDVRQHVDELLLGERAVSGLRPFHKVRREVEDEERKLWRPDRVGKPRARELEREIAAQRKVVAEAAAADRSLREAFDERDGLVAEVEGLREERRRLDGERADAEFLARLASVRRALRATDDIDLAELDASPLTDPAELARVVEELEAGLAAPRARLARERVELDPSHERALAAAARFDALREERSGHEAARRALEEADAELARLGRELAGELERIGVAAAGGGVERPEPPLDALRAVQSEWSAAWERGGGPGPEARRVPLWIPVLAAGGTAVVATSALGALPPILGLLGAGLLVLAFSGALARARSERAPELPPGPPADLERLLAGWPVDPALRASPSGVQRLVERFEALAERRARAREVRERRAGLAHSIDAWEEAVRALCGELGLDAPTPDAGLARLAAGLERAREAEAARRRDVDERARAAASVEALEPELRRRRQGLERVLAVLERNAPGVADARARFALLHERIDERTAAEHRERELRADARWERLGDDPRADLPDERAPWSDTAVAARAAELERLDAALQAASTRTGEIAQLLRDAPESAAARARDDLLELEQELEGVLRARDRLALLARLLGEADRRYRDAHQPDVLRCASRYVAAITGGRYRRLDWVDAVEDEPAGLQVAGGSLDEPVRVEPPLSRGTRDQIYLSLRLGLLDHLDADRERLPLVLDEALVHWDGGRRAEVYRVLEQVADRRQVLLLTCHEHLAEEAVAALGARRIDLSAPEPSGDRPRAVL